MLSFESAMALFINLYLIFVIEVAASLEYFDFLRLAPQLLNLNMRCRYRQVLSAFYLFI
jgi:hypothetical protein